MKYLIYLILLITYFPLKGQNYVLETSEIAFFSEAPLENIDAATIEAKSIFRPSDGSLAIQIPMNTFQFKKSLMQQHFNENFLETDLYPYATFSGKIHPFKNQPGRQEAQARGELTIHGVTHPVVINGILEQKDGKIYMQAKFPITLKDFNIQIPKIVFFNIAETVDVVVKLVYKKG